jgi:hypothetical protein
MSTTISRLREEWADREAIRDCLLSYVRGIDRGDEAMLRSAYWPDATDDHAGLFSGSAADYIDQAVQNTGSRCPTAHFVTNEFIRLNGDQAAVESYVYAIHSGMEYAGAERDIIVAARYIDRFERRDDQWRIAARSVAIDWFREYDDTADWKIGPFGLGNASRGGSKPKDASYSLFGLSEN